MIDAVGLLDATFTSCDCAILDWVMPRPSPGLFRQTGEPCLRPSRIRLASYSEIRRCSTAAQRCSSSGTMSTGPRPRHSTRRSTASWRRMPRSFSGRASCASRTIFATCPHKASVLAPMRSTWRELAGLPQIELTLLVASPIQADGLEGRVVTEEQWTDDVAVIHKPAKSSTVGRRDPFWLVRLMLLLHIKT